MKIFYILLCCSLSLFAKSEVKTVYDHTDVTISSMTAGKAKDGINDLAKIEDNALSIYKNENTDLSTDLKLQKHWSFVVAYNEYELERNVKLFDNLIDVHSISEELHNLSLEGVLTK